MGFLAFDLRDALRSFRRDVAYAVTVVLTLALTIGATSAVFSIVNGVLLKPLAYSESDRLVALREIWRQPSARDSTLAVNERHFEYWRAHARSFDSLAQYRVLPTNLAARGEASQISVASCSGSLFDVLRVRPSLGRTLTPRDEREDAPAVVTIADSLWRQRFGADPGIVGTAISIGGKPYTIVGVLPQEFRLPRGDRPSAPAEAFVPLHVDVGWVGDHNDDAIGRLREGSTVEQARAELDVLQAQISEIATKEAHETITLASAVTPLAEHVAATSRTGLLLLLGTIAGVLLMACSNLANLSLTRTLGRLRETAIRSALGAGRRRLVGRTLLEQLVLSAIGGALGLGVAWAALALFVRTAPIDLPRVDEVALDGHVLRFSAVVSILTGVLVAILPAWRIAGSDLQTALSASTAAVASDRGALRSHAALLALQVGLCVTLLIVTGLFGASFLHVMTADRGFAAERVLAVDLSFPAARYAEESVRQATYDRLLAAVHALPRVEGATTTSMLPLHGAGQVNFIAPEGNTLPVSHLPSANFRFVAPDYFRTLGIVVRRGRSFSDAERDPNRPAPALVSEPTAMRLWPGENPIGKRFSRGIATEQGFEVVGVVADARTTSLDRAQPLMVYLPYWWRSRPSLSVMIKTTGDPSSILPGVRRVVREIDPEIAIGQSRPLEDLVDASVAGRRYQVQLFVAFGLMALFIATLGVYAVTSYGVSRRRREMNIRVALGAQTSQVIGLVLRQGMAPVIAGLVTGTCGALAIGGVVASLLFEVRASDPMVIAIVVVIVGSVGLATCALATRRGLSIAPSSALRAE